jgi:hypothetical protein
MSSKKVIFKGIQLIVKGDDAKHIHEEDYRNIEAPKPNPSLVMRTLEQYRRNESSNGNFESFDVGTVRRLGVGERSRYSYDHGVNDGFDPVQYEAWANYAQAESEKGFEVPVPYRFERAYFKPEKPKTVDIKPVVVTPEMIEMDKQLDKTKRKYL